VNSFITGPALALAGRRGF